MASAHGVALERFGSAAAFAFAGEQIGRDGDEALGGERVGDAAHPIGQAEDLVDDDDDGRLSPCARDRRPRI